MKEENLWEGDQRSNHLTGAEGLVEETSKGRVEGQERNEIKDGDYDWIVEG